MKATKSHFFCYNCGERNFRLRLWCNSCHKWLRPVDKNATNLGENLVKDKIKDDLADNFFGKLTTFIQQHAFGLLFSFTLIAGVLPNLLVFGNSDEIQTVTSAPTFLTEEEEEKRGEEREAEQATEHETEESSSEEKAEEENSSPEPASESSSIPVVVTQTPASSSYGSFDGVLSGYFTAQSSVASTSDFNTLNSASFTAAERSSLLSAGVVPLSAGAFSPAANSWTTIRPINIEGRTSVVYNALDLERYKIGDYTKIGRSEYILEVYDCRTASCTPPSGSWSLSNVREISYYYLLLISLTNPSTSDTKYYHLITSTNLPTSYNYAQYFFISVYAPTEDSSRLFNFSQWFARDWYPYDYTN